MLVDAMPLWSFLIETNWAVASVFAEKLARRAAYVPKTMISDKLESRKRFKLHKRIVKRHTRRTGRVLKALQLVLKAMERVFKWHGLHKKMNNLRLSFRTAFDKVENAAKEFVDFRILVHRDKKILKMGIFVTLKLKMAERSEAKNAKRSFASN